jgi:hypothetical protein
MCSFPADDETDELVANVVDPARPETWVFHYCLSIWTAEDAPENAEARRALFKHYISRYCEPYKSVGEWLSQDTPILAEKVRLERFRWRALMSCSVSLLEKYNAVE